MAQTIIPAGTNGIRDKAAIVGIGETEFSWNSGRSEIQLAAEAIKAACDDAGIAPQDIDGLVRYEMDSNHETLLVQTLGIKNLRHWESVAYRRGRRQRRGRPCRRRYLRRVLQLRRVLSRRQPPFRVTLGPGQGPRADCRG